MTDRVKEDREENIAWAHLKCPHGHGTAQANEPGDWVAVYASTKCPLCPKDVVLARYKKQVDE